MILSIILVVIVLSLLVLMHEWGHYIAAKKVGIHVEEFGIGLPPKLFTLFKRKGTEFTVNAIPLGGFVKLAGDDAESLEQSDLEEKQRAASNLPLSSLFSSKTQLQRLFVIYAGAFMNILFGIVAFAVIFTKIGIPTQLPHPLIEKVVEHSPASDAGLQSGDEILEINSGSVATSTQVRALLEENRGQKIEMRVKRQEQILTLNPYIRTESETPPQEGSLGIAMIDLELQQFPWWQMPVRGAIQGLKDSVLFAAMILNALGTMVKQLVLEQVVPQELSGPLGIADMAVKENIFGQGILVALNFAALISINLGVVNVLPIPALDGGRALFIVLERVLGVERRKKFELYANRAGMAFLLFVLLLISVKDVITIFFSA